MFENPDLSGRYRVDEMGDITVPLIGPVHVAGMTADEAAATIEKLYVEGQILLPANSHATVFISEYATQGITINGEVRTPGVYPALGVHKLNDLIAAAGGITPLAASHVVITHKDDPGNPITVEYNPSALKPIIPDVQIFPGDSILVPRAGVVYVVGNVAKPGAYVLDGRRALTVEEAMALAGGGGHASAMKRVQLVRTLDDGRKEAITIPVNLIYKGQAPDVALRDGDILYVPTSNGQACHRTGHQLPRSASVPVSRSTGLHTSNRAAACTLRSRGDTSGGANRSPDFKQAQLLRTMDDGSKEAITIPVHQVFKGVAADGGSEG